MPTVTPSLMPSLIPSHVASVAVARRSSPFGAPAVVLAAMLTVTALAGQEQPRTTSPGADAASSEASASAAKLADALRAELGAFAEKRLRRCPAAVLGVLAGDQRVVVGHGEMHEGSTTEPDGRTVFEVGSISKVFTGLCLASLAQEGRLRLDDPVQKWLPKATTLQQVGERPITLLDLTTHRSGLPRLPRNLVPADLSNPYADYRSEQLLACVPHARLAHAAGAGYEYSNFGVGLLGWILTRAAPAIEPPGGGRSEGGDGEGPHRPPEPPTWEELVVARVCAPLGLVDTRVQLNDEQRARFATPRDLAGRAVPAWDFDALAGAGALRSTADDLLRFLAANLGHVEGDAARALLPVLKDAQRPRTSDEPRVALGWHFVRVPAGGGGEARECLWHNGGTAGTSSFVAFAPAGGIAVVLLATRPLDSASSGVELLQLAHRFERP